jgi:hypothetical protein
MINKLNQKLPTLEQFTANIDNKLYYSSKNTKQKKLVQYVLKRFEYKKQNYNVELKDVSLEHIYPKKFDKYWDKIDEKYIQNIGNLVLLDKGINSYIGNKEYSEKKKIILEKSTLITTKEVFQNNPNWSAGEIDNRRNLLIGELYGI